MNNSPGLDLTPPLWLALCRLRKAHDAARRLERSPWDFAVEIRDLEEAGIDHDDLRTLICRRLAEHALETTRPHGKRRTFRTAASLRLAAESCFVLSDLGLAVSQSTAAPTNGHTNGQSNGHAPPAPPAPLVPVWDSARRELRLGELVLKRFRQPAKNQEIILAVFQEEGWPPRIDNPISGALDENAAERLHNTIKRLNQQMERAIRFCADGTAEGVMWRMDGAHRERTGSAPGYYS
jgi:hypothetical protein